MSEINAMGETLYGPPVFPVEGRLPGTPQAVLENYYKQGKQESDYCQGRDENGNRRAAECCQSIHISLFFDGTNNNNDADTKAGHPSNVAKLFHASFRDTAAKDVGYFSYYMPGVGTAFPEIGEYEYSKEGLKYATGGEDRINWALVQVASALSYVLNQKQDIDRSVAKLKVEQMATWKLPLMHKFGPGNRRAVMRDLLEPLRPLVPWAQPKPLAVKLFVYGFSRGAAEARTFVNWLAELFETPQGADKPEQTLIGLPVSVEFLGLLDTVASVGIARVAPFFAGHMDWADGSQLLPDASRYPGFVKVCRHFVAAHEQRACFPLDSLRNEAGRYPAVAREVLYPGVHSDVGGGYPMGEQGKARGGIGELLSQVPLHDLYAEAFAAGAPLQVPEAMLPEGLRCERSWRGMSEATFTEFGISDVVAERFNAWRTTVPGLSTEPSSGPAWKYEAQRVGLTTEQALADQLYWITGWRIGRYANGSYRTQPFYLEAKDTDPATVEKKQADYDKTLGDARTQRLNEPETAVLHPGPRIYEAQMDRTQLSQAAEEFRYDYSGEKREQTSWQGEVFDVVLRDSIYLLNDDDERRDEDEIKSHGEKRSQQLFRDERGTPTGDPALALLVALFDDQVHDSRAWFMHDQMKTREIWAGYFFHRMIYFGDDSSRRLTPMMVAGKLVGVAMIAGATVYGIRLLRGNALKAAAGGVAGVAAGVLLTGVTYQVLDKATGLVVPFLPDAAELLKPTERIGAVAAQQKRTMALADYAERMRRTTEYLRQTGSLVERAPAVLS